MSDTVLRPEIVQTPRGAQDFGVIEKPLTVFERLYNQVWLRKLFLIAVLIVAFWRVRPLAGMLLLPYLAWVGFATALNVATWWLNTGIL